MRQVEIIYGYITFYDEQFDGRTEAVVHQIDHTEEVAENIACEVAESRIETSNPTIYDSYIIPAIYKHPITFEN